MQVGRGVPGVVRMGAHCEERQMVGRARVVRRELMGKRMVVVLLGFVRDDNGVAGWLWEDIRFSPPVNGSFASGQLALPKRVPKVWLDI